MSSSAPLSVFFPRQRGWFGVVLDEPLEPFVLPAPAGVVRRPPRHHLARRRSSRASGGGSHIKNIRRLVDEFFPHQRGWFVPDDFQVAELLVLPAPAGVVRRRREVMPYKSFSLRTSRRAIKMPTQLDWIEINSFGGSRATS